MVSSAKLAVNSETEEGALIEHCLVFQHLFYILIEKEPSRLYYIAPINFLEKPLYSSCVFNSDGI